MAEIQIQRDFLTIQDFILAYILQVSSTMSDENELQEPLVERLSGSPELASKQTSNKRKRGPVEQGARKAAKKSKKTKTVEDDGLDLENNINTAFAHMDSQLLADYVAQRTSKHQSDLSTVELEDKYLPGKERYIESRPF